MGGPWPPAPIKLFFFYFFMKGMGVEGEDTKEFTKIIIILIGLSSSLWSLPFYHSLTPVLSLVWWLALSSSFLCPIVRVPADELGRVTIKYYKFIVIIKAFYIKKVI